MLKIIVSFVGLLGLSQVSHASKRFEFRNLSSNIPRFFQFSSEAQVTPVRIEQLLKLYGKNILIGGDPNQPGFDITMAAAEKARVRKHVYLEGPGGPTGNKGIESSEYQRMIDGAKRQKIDVTKKNWLKEWNSWGWIGHTRELILYYTQQGFESVEIDNMYRGLTNDPARHVSFFIDHQLWMDGNGISTTTVLKNLDGAMLLAIEKAINEDRTLRRDIFSDFAIFEDGTGEPAEQAEISQRIGIQPIFTHDTENYMGESEYKVKK